MNKKYKLILLAMLLLQGCQAKGNNSSEEIKIENLVNENSLYAGSIMDTPSSNHVKTYKVKAGVTDEYYINCVYAEKLNVYDEKNNLLKSDCFDTTIDLKKGETYYIEIEAYEDYEIELYPLNNQIVTPYEINCTTDFDKYDTNSVDYDPLSKSKIELIQRKGGTYLYSNVPERMPYEVVNTILMQQKDLTGECFLTFEHQNGTILANDIYLGYRITNLEDHDIYVTIMNVGHQVDGSWVGEKSWMDYYGVTFNVEKDKFKEGTFSYDNNEWTAQSWYRAYLNYKEDYQPNPIKPITYKLPPNEHIYVIGGTSQDAYKNINVNNTADKILTLGNCANGNVRFNITNGKAIGELCVYNDIKEINKKDVTIQNLRRYGEKDDYGGRIGYSPIHGVIDNNPVWEFNDLTGKRSLPVEYQVYYADELKSSYEPFEEISNCYYHEVENYRWLTNLSAQLNHKYCGTDMVDIHTICDGKNVTLSNYIANPAGKIWDYGNWMIEYQENCTFVNKGDKDRTLQFYLSNNSSLFYIVKDLQNQILKSGATAKVCTGEVPIIEFSVPAHSIQTLSFQYVLPANTCGSVEHKVKIID